MEKQKTKAQEIIPLQNGEAKKDEKKVALAADFGQFYVTVHGGQLMAPVRAQMTLYERLGQIYKIPGGRKDAPPKYNITASGYSHLNKVASISVITPQSVVVDGRPVPNPHIERNQKTKAIESVNIRKMGIGYSPAGNVVVIDKTLFYNVYTYLIQSIQAKMKREEWESGKPTGKKQHPDCAFYGVENDKPEKEGSWYFLPTEGMLGIWINYEDQAIIDCLEEHTQRQRFGDRIAQKIVERNILKDHPAIATSQVFEKQGPSGFQAAVVVYGYRNENDPTRISELMKQAEKGTASKDFEMQAETIDTADVEEEKTERKDVAGDEFLADETPNDQPLFKEKK